LTDFLKARFGEQGLQNIYGGGQFCLAHIRRAVDDLHGGGIGQLRLPFAG
jgi:hypothetical protein